MTAADLITSKTTQPQPERRAITFEIRQIDAYMYEDEWTYNTTYNLGSFTTAAANPVKAFRAALARMGIRFHHGTTRTEYDGDICEIIDRHDGMPLFVAIPQEV